MAVSNNKPRSEQWLSPREVGERLPSTPTAQAVRQWCAKGLVPRAVRLPNGRWLIPESAVAQLLEGGASEP